MNTQPLQDAIQRGLAMEKERIISEFIDKLSHTATTTT